ncbi:DMT family transporter [Thermoanaerobacterium sp. DL9XJH110]|uniref:DMT family transporter n=1 Tax=Thermoanaerobacterium sp. DL9XJH110 TaxID=3386643 RepID=UPI003BB7CAEA
MKKSLLADGALLFLTINWGLNFVIMKDALSDITPYMYLGVRFILSSLLLALVFFRQLLHIKKQDLAGGLLIGAFLFLGFVTQTVGLIYTTPAKSGFITGSNVVMVPFLAYFLNKNFPGWHQVLGASITFIGMGIVSINRNFTVNYGDVLTLACAVFFALQIVFTEYYVKRANPINIAVVQISLVGVLTTAIGLAAEPLPKHLDGSLWAAIIYGVIFCTAGAFVIQNVAQKYTSSTHAAVIMSLESVFAGLFSWLLWKEPLTFKTVCGFALMLAGVLITELMPAAEKPEALDFHSPR